MTHSILPASIGNLTHIEKSTIHTEIALLASAVMKDMNCKRIWDKHEHFGSPAHVRIADA
jgi:hypothetical protein